MNHKRWISLFLAAASLLLLGFGFMMYLTDPLIQFGTESGFFTYHSYSDLYSNPGIAKNYSYDTVLVGTSMIENTDVQECNQAFGCDMVRLSYSGGTSYNMKTILDVCFATGKEIKTVYWELDEFQLLSSHDSPRHPLPTYLYRNDNREILKYLLNLEIFYHYTIPNIKGTLAGLEQKVAREGISWDGDFSKAGALRFYTRPEQAAEKLPQTHYLEQTKLNLHNNITPLVEANPDTEFVFFFVPFSMLYWDNELRNGTFDTTMYCLEYTISQLLAYDNVRMYFYHDEWDIASNLDNYKDYSHYAPWVNSYIIKAIAKEDSLLTEDNYKQILNQMHHYVTTFDYEPIFE